jgi:hypothetical protein
MEALSLDLSLVMGLELLRLERMDGGLTLCGRRRTISPVNFFSRVARKIACYFY